MKEFPITLNFDDNRVVGSIALTEHAMALLKASPEHCITFSFTGEGMVDPETEEPLEPWQVIGAALIPNMMLPKGKYKDLRK